MPRTERDPYFQGICEAAKLQHFTIEVTGKQHWRFTPPDKSKPAVLWSGSPGDYRAIRNFVAQLRRSGFRCPENLRK